MGPGDNLIVGEVNSMCGASISALNSQSSTLGSLSAAFSSAMSAPNICGVGYDAAGLVAGDIQCALALMQAANDLDIMDFETLMASIGGEDLIGQEIISKMEEAAAREEATSTSISTEARRISEGSCPAGSRD